MIRRESGAKILMPEMMMLKAGNRPFHTIFSIVHLSQFMPCHSAVFYSRIYAVSYITSKLTLSDFRLPTFKVNVEN